jgi:hypothetical protein
MMLGQATNIHFIFIFVSRSSNYKNYFGMSKELNQIVIYLYYLGQELWTHCVQSYF